MPSGADPSIDLFFYGPLTHAPLLQIVLGQRDADVVEAMAPDRKVAEIDGLGNAGLRADKGQRAPGIVVRDPEADAVARVTYYCATFGFDPVDCLVDLKDGQSATVRTFVPRRRVRSTGTDWSLADWTDRWSTQSVHAAQEVMDFFGRRTPDEMSRSLTGIRLRAAAREAAAARAGDGTHDVARDVVVDDHHRACLSYFAFDEMDLRHRRYDGSMSGPLNRSALVTGQAAILLPYDPVRDMVLLVEQFRAPVFMIGDPAPWMWEPVAGMIDPGETAKEAALREAREEAHLHLDKVEPAGGAYSSSGSSTEFLHLFIGIGDLTGTTEQGGLDSEGEDIRSRILSFDEMMQMVDTHQFKDLPLLSVAHWLARHRDRLRKEAGVR